MKLCQKTAVRVVRRGLLFWGSGGVCLLLPALAAQRVCGVSVPGSPSSAPANTPRAQDLRNLPAPAQARHSLSHSYVALFPVCLLTDVGSYMTWRLLFVLAQQL